LQGLKELENEKILLKLFACALTLNHIFASRIYTQARPSSNSTQNPTPILLRKAENRKTFLLILNTCTMKKSTPIHINEGLRNAIIVILIFGIIAIISYMEWAGRI
jgi:hypothetical protein